MKRCSWVKNEIEIPYHDNEWGKKSTEDSYLFEMLILEGMQAGLSWNLILSKREAMREAFYGFDPDKLKDISEEDITTWLSNPHLVRNKLKLRSLKSNALAYFKVLEEYPSFSDYIWSFTHGETITNSIQSVEDYITDSELSQEISKDLKRRGFKFVGPVIIYSYMQAIGMINDHENSCSYK